MGNPSLEQRINNLLQLQESLRTKPYKCSRGFLTIGYGRNLETRGITVAEADMLLQNDLKEIMPAVEKEFPWYNKLNTARKLVILSMVYNLGMGGFRGFKRMIYALDRQQWDNAAVEMQCSKWARQTGWRAKQLAVMMQTGVLPDELQILS